jgi:hypothetical protein
MTTYRKKSAVAIWATAVVLVALVMYPLIFGVWCYSIGRWGYENWAVVLARPLFVPLDILKCGPKWLNNTYLEYSKWWMVRGRAASRPGPKYH